MNNFESIGAHLLAAGYLIIPIQRGAKRPAIDGWQNARLTAHDLHRYNGYGVGILTGQGATPLCAVDIDTTFPDLAEEFVGWLAGRFGLTVVRIGNAPKVLAVYRQARPFRKSVSTWYDDYLGHAHRLEILGTGQQFVAYAIHPDTQRPYQWVDLFGGLIEVAPADLPVLSVYDVAEVLREWDERAARGGLIARGIATTPPAAAESAEVPDALSHDDAEGGGGEVASTALAAYTPPLGLTIDQARELVALQDASVYETWLKVGMALHHEFSSRGEHESDAFAFQLWNDWSQGAPNYAGVADLAARWTGFGKSAGAALGAGGANSRRAVTMRSLVKAAAELGPAPLAGERATARRGAYGYTEFGNADRLVDQYGAGLMFVPGMGAWYVWTGVYWRAAAEAEMRQYARLTVESMREEGERLDADAREALVKWCRRSQTAAMCGNLLRLAEASPLVMVAAEALDRERWLLGVQNGAVDLRTGRLLPPDPPARITRVCRVAFDAEARCGLWERTLLEIFQGDAELVGLWQRLLGYALLGEPVEDLLVLLWGIGSNGKSTALSVARYVLGTYAAMVPASTVVADHGGPSNAGAARPDLLRLAGVRLAAMTEPDEGSELREGFVKSVTGGEPVVARALYSSTMVEVTPSWVCFMATNHRPTIKGDDWGIWRRILLVPFEANFDAGVVMPDGSRVRKDPDREARLRDEAPGILAWMVRGALAYQRMGLAIPARLEAARQEYRTDMDLLAGWLDERTRKTGEDYGELLDSLWLDWENWARVRGELRLIASRRALSRRLRSRGYLTEKTMHGLRVLGIKLQKAQNVENHD